MKLHEPEYGRTFNGEVHEQVRVSGKYMYINMYIYLNMVAEILHC